MNAKNGRTPLAGMDWVRVRWAELWAGRLQPQQRLAWLAGGTLLLLLAVLWVVAAVVTARLAPTARARLIAVMEAQLRSPVRVGAVETHFDGGVRVDANDVEAQSVQPGVPGDPATPMLRVEHLHVQVALLPALMSGLFGRRTDAVESGAGAGWTAKNMMAHVQRVTLEGAHLRFDNGHGGRAPLQFDLPRVELTGLERLNSEGTFDYQATVDAGAPVGLVDTRGTMGPWNAGDPRATPLAGTFAFENRNVGSASLGMSGMLSMRAKYTGTLSRLETEGTTDDPVFGLSVSAHTVALKTAFKMLIDAAHDQITIESLEAQFLRTHFVVNGTVTKAPQTGAYAMDFQLSVPQGRVEDALTLGARTEPPLLRGALTMTGRLLLPTGAAPIAHRLELQDGQFGLDGVQFGKESVQQSADTLSEKATGHPKRAEAGEVASTSAKVTGRVGLQDGTMHLTAVRLAAPGTTLALMGFYQLGGSGFEMRGTLHTEATASEMHTGIKGVLLRPFNGLMGHGRAGTTLPLEVTGHGNEPHFRVTMPGGAKMDALQ